jgi:hypothetical protein
VAEKAEWQEQLASCVRKRKADSATGVCAVTKQLKAAAQQPRLATYNHGLRLDNAIVNGLHSQGLDVWIPTDPERPAAEDMVIGEPEPPLLVSLCDEEGKQWSLYYFCIGKRQAQWHQQNGSIHRRQNDFHRALARAGVMDSWMTVLFEINIGRGPLASKGWYLEMEGFGFDAGMNMDPDHPLPLFCWAGICDDKKWTDDDDVDCAARKRFLDNLVAARPVRIVGGQSRFQQMVVHVQRSQGWR